MMRYFAVCLAALLAACTSEEESAHSPDAHTSSEVKSEGQATSQKRPDQIECALGDGSTFGSDCRVERVTKDGAENIIVRHPDGGFRRFVLREDGGGLSEIDGADTVTQQLANGVLEVSVGDDRYRFPTQAKPGSEPDTSQANEELPQQNDVETQ